MAKQRLTYGENIDALTGEEFFKGLSKITEAARLRDEVLARAVRRVRSASVPATPVTSTLLLGGPEGIDGPVEGMAWAIHRVTITTAAVAPAGTQVYLEITGGQDGSTAVSTQKGLGVLYTPGTAYPQATGDVFFPKGAVTLYAGDFITGKSPAGVTDLGPFTMVIEGIEVPRPLLWKLWI